MEKPKIEKVRDLLNANGFTTNCTANIIHVYYFPLDGDIKNKITTFLYEHKIKFKKYINYSKLCYDSIIF